MKANFIRHSVRLDENYHVLILTDDAQTADDMIQWAHDEGVESSIHYMRLNDDWSIQFISVTPNAFLCFKLRFAG